MIIIAGILFLRKLEETPMHVCGKTATPNITASF